MFIPVCRAVTQSLSLSLSISLLIPSGYELALSALSHQLHVPWPLQVSHASLGPDSILGASAHFACPILEGACIVIHEALVDGNGVRVDLGLELHQACVGLDELLVVLLNGLT